MTAARDGEPAGVAGMRPEVVCRLAAAGCVAADEEAGEMVAAAPDRATLGAWMRRREAGEPLAWIVGTIEFCGHAVGVDPGVYVPRLQSEELARRGASLLAAAAAAAGASSDTGAVAVSAGDRAGGPSTPGGTVDPTSGRAAAAADLCTGAGAIAVHLASAVPAATVVGVDVDPGAVTCAHRNGVLAAVGDLGGPLRSHAFDVVTAVAPYVPTGALPYLPADVVRYEPLRTLDGGADGLCVVRQVVESATRLLRSGGWLLVELGGDEADSLGTEMVGNGWDAVSTWSDGEGDLRGLAARRQRA